MGKEDPVELESSLALLGDMRGVAEVGDGNIAGEIPLLSSLLYLRSWAERVRRCFDLVVTVFYSRV